MNIKFPIIIFSIFFGLFNESKAQESELKTQETDAKLSVSNIWEEPVVEPLLWNHFTAKYDFNASLNNPSQKGAEEIAGTLSIRMRKDSVLWFTVSASIGIQVMKGIIRKDSAFILDNFNKKAYLLSLEDLNKINDLPANLLAIQKIFTGEILTSKLLRDASSEYAKSALSSECFTGVEPQFKSYSVALSNQSVSQFQLREPNRGATLDVFFPTRITTENGKHPEEIKLIASKIEAQAAHPKVRLDLSLKTARFDFIPSYPFFIPSDYERVDIKNL